MLVLRLRRFCVVGKLLHRVHFLRFGCRLAKLTSPCLQTHSSSDCLQCIWTEGHDALAHARNIGLVPREGGTQRDIWSVLQRSTYVVLYDAHMRYFWLEMYFSGFSESLLFFRMQKAKIINPRSGPRSSLGVWGETICACPGSVSPWNLCWASTQKQSSKSEKSTFI